MSHRSNLLPAVRKRGAPLALSSLVMAGVQVLAVADTAHAEEPQAVTSAPPVKSRGARFGRAERNAPRARSSGVR